MMEVTVVELLQKHATFVPLEYDLERIGVDEHHNPLMHSEPLSVDLQEG